MDVKQGERSVRTKYCLRPPLGGRVYFVQRSEPQFYLYLSTVLTFLPQRKIFHKAASRTAGLSSFLMPVPMFFIGMSRQKK